MSESLLYLGRVRSALVGHLVLLLFCTTAAASHGDGFELYRGYLLVPVFRLASVGIPVFVVPALQFLHGGIPGAGDLSIRWLLIIYGPFVPALLVAVRYDDAAGLVRGLGRRKIAVVVPTVLVLSVGFATVQYEILRPTGLVSSLDSSEFAVFAVVMVGVVGLVEELLFRGLLQGGLRSRLGPGPAILLSSVVFAVMHSVYQLPVLMASAFGFGLVAGYLYHRTRSLPAVVLLHGLTNALLFGVFPVTGPWVALG